MRRALAALALGVLVLVGGVRGAGAATRVYDAQVAPGARARAIPAAPPEYLTEGLGWVKIVYHPSTRDRVRALIPIAAEIRAELGAMLGREALTTAVEVRIAAAPAELDRLSPIELAEGATAAAFAGFGAEGAPCEARPGAPNVGPAFGAEGAPCEARPGAPNVGPAIAEGYLVVISAGSRLSTDPPDIEATFRHELAHLALDEATAGAPLPQWLHEGLATHAGDERAAGRTKTLALAALRRRFIPLAELDPLLPQGGPHAPVAHAEAADLLRFLLQPERRARFADFIDHARDGAPPLDALARAHGAGLSELDVEWREDMARRYGFVPVLAISLLALLLAVAAGRGLGRLRSPRAAAVRRASPRRHVRGDPEPRARPARPVTSAVVAARGARARGDVDGDSDIPKVEHDGRWHTLH